MARRRGSHVGRRRALDQAARFGEEVRVARATLGLSREQAARQAGVSWSTQRRVEVGDPAVSLDTACSVASAVGLDTVLRVYPGRPPGLRDTGQLELAEQLRSAAHPSLISALEQPAGSHAESADLLFLGATEILHHEIERLVTDFQASTDALCASGRRWRLSIQGRCGWYGRSRTHNGTGRRWKLTSSSSGWRCRRGRERSCGRSGVASHSAGTACSGCAGRPSPRPAAQARAQLDVSMSRDTSTGSPARVPFSRSMADA